MNIIKNGRPQLPQLFRGTCKKCDCCVEEERQKLYSHGLGDNRPFFGFCPVEFCGGKITMTPKNESKH